MPIFEVQAGGKTYEVDAPSMEIAVQAFSAPEKAPKAPKSYGMGQGALTSFANAASFGLADELYGGLSALTGGDYDSAVADMRQRLGQFEDDNPGTAFTAGLAGSLATGIGGAGKLAATKAGKAAVDAYKATNAAGRFAANVGAGALSGAATGAGNAVEGERGMGALTGGALGAGTGALVQPIAYGAKKAVDLLAPPVRWASDRIAMGPEQQFARKLAQQAERDGLTPEQVAAQLRKLGPNAMLADVGENVRGMAEGYAMLPGQAKRAANAALMKRAKGQAGRATKAVLDGLDLGADDLNFDQQIQNVHATMREVGKGYAPIVDTAETPMNDKIRRLMKGPTMQSALASAKSIAADDVANGEVEETVLRRLASIEVTPAKTDALGMLTEGPGMNLGFETKPTLRVWDYAKRGLDAIIGEGTDPVTGKLTPQAQRALKTKNILLSEIDTLAPAYKEVRKKYADQFSLETALKLGRSAFGQDAEVIARHVADMSEPEQKMFRAGAARAIRDKILLAPDTGDAYKRVFGNELMRNKVRSIFPDAKSYTKFAREMQREAVFGSTKNAILGNSRTAAREALKDDAGIDPSVVGDIAQGRVGALAMRLAGRGVQSATEVPEATRNIAAQYLFSTDPAQKAKALQMLSQQAGILNSRQPRLTPPSPLLPLGAGLLGMQVGQ